MQQQSETMTAGADRATASALEEISEAQNPEQIVALAYECWQGRGCPDGTPDEDWFRAEREIAGSKRIDEKEDGSRDFAKPSMDAKETDSPVLRFPVRSEVFQASQGRASRRA